MINADGTEQKKVGFPGISSDNISWSYDDQSLFFTGITTSQMRDYSIRRYAVSTGVISEISPRLSMPYGYPEASPRQNSVFYRDGTNMSLAELDLGSSRSYGGNGFRFRWSSDGLSVAYDNVGIYTLRLSDGARTIISADEGQGPKYSPDGTKIAYEFPSGTFKIVDSKSAQALYIIQTNGRYFCWSPDSPECAYDDMLGYLWVSSLDGQTKKRIASGVICFDW
jgi:Tol biopolymer transport system component